MTHKDPNCIFESCERPVISRQMCNAHYQQWDRGEELRTIRPRMKKGAKCKNCEQPAHRILLCRDHFNEYMRNGGRVRAPRAEHNPPERIPCPVLNCTGKATSVTGLCSRHRIWGWKYGIPFEIVADVLADPKCRNRACESTEDLVMDHDHRCCPSNRKTCGNCNRGFLCRRCNTALGMLRDDPEVIQGLLDCFDDQLK